MNEIENEPEVWGIMAGMIDSIRLLKGMPIDALSKKTNCSGAQLIRTLHQGSLGSPPVSVLMRCAVCMEVDWGVLYEAARSHYALLKLLAKT